MTVRLGRDLYDPPAVPLSRFSMLLVGKWKKVISTFKVFYALSWKVEKVILTIFEIFDNFESFNNF